MSVKEKTEDGLWIAMFSSSAPCSTGMDSR
jgi:hypothetical protein